MSGSPTADAEDAWSQFKRGDYDGAQTRFERLLADQPDDPHLLTRYGRVLVRRGSSQAEAVLRRALELSPTSSETLISLADLLARTRRLEEAEAVYEQTLAAHPAELHALLGLARLKARAKRHSEAYVLYARAMKIAPQSAAVHSAFSKALLGHAMRLAERALELDPSSPRATVALASALNLSSRGEEAEAVVRRAQAANPSISRLRNQIGGPSAGRRTRPAVWPRKLEQFRNLEQIFREHVAPGSIPERPILSKASKVTTLGSCFAEHIASSLREQGVDVWFEKRSESLDNLFANRQLIEWVADPGFESRYFPDAPWRVGFRERFETAEVVILSLGVAAAYFHQESGELVIPSVGNKHLLAAESEFRMMSVEDNAAELRRIIALLRQMNPDVRIVLTVSPIPLAATLDRPSAIQADAVSKSTMRLAVESVMMEGAEDVYYWPSFEMVRWCGAHLTQDYPPVFGDDDGGSRHVSMWLVRIILRLFIEYFAEGFSAQAPVEAEMQP
jgi:tetratricopeptide (TPR) repeat protein